MRWSWLKNKFQTIFPRKINGVVLGVNSVIVHFMLFDLKISGEKVLHTGFTVCASSSGAAPGNLKMWRLKYWVGALKVPFYAQYVQLGPSFFCFFCALMFSPTELTTTEETSSPRPRPQSRDVPHTETSTTLKHTFHFPSSTAGQKGTCGWLSNLYHHIVHQPGKHNLSSQPHVPIVGVEYILHSLTQLLYKEL